MKSQTQQRVYIARKLIYKAPYPDIKHDAMGNTGTKQIPNVCSIGTWVGNLSSYLITFQEGGK